MNKRHGSYKLSTTWHQNEVFTTIDSRHIRKTTFSSSPSGVSTPQIRPRKNFFHFLMFFSYLEYICKVSSKSAMVSFREPTLGGEGGICQKIFKNKGHDSIKLSTRWHWNEVSTTIFSYRYAANKLFWKKNWNPILGGKGAFVKKFSRTKGTTPVKYLQDDTKMKSLRQFVDIDMPRTKKVTDRRTDGQITQKLNMVSDSGGSHKTKKKNFEKFEWNRNFNYVFFMRFFDPKAYKLRS